MHGMINIKNIWEFVLKTILKEFYRICIGLETILDISKVMLWEIFMMDRFERHCYQRFRICMSRYATESLTD